MNNIEELQRISHRLEYEIKSARHIIGILDDQCKSKDALIDSRDNELYRRNLECRSLERKSDASLMICILCTIVTFTTMGFVILL